METAFSEETIKALEESIQAKATGKTVAEYEIAGRKVRYDTMDLPDMQELLRTMRKSVQAAKAKANGGKSGRRRYALLSTGKGL